MRTLSRIDVVAQAYSEPDRARLLRLSFAQEAHMARLLFSCVLVTVVGVGSAWAHHTVPGRVHPTVTITQPVLADGKPLAAGTYELWVSEDRPDVGAG